MAKTENSIRILVGVLFLVTAFHLCLIVKLIPYNIAWGGRLTNDTEMYVYEAVSIFINLFFMAVVLMKGNYLKWRWNEKLINAILWIFFFIFILNTIGNLLSNSSFEKLFSVVTLFLTLLIWNVLKKNK